MVNNIRDYNLMEFTGKRAFYKKKYLTSLSKHIAIAYNFKKPLYHLSSSISKPKCDLTSSIDHSTKLYHKIKNTQSDLYYGSSTTASITFENIRKSRNINQANDFPTNHSYTHSRNTVNYIRHHDYRTESLTQFNENIKLKRMYNLINKVQSNHLIQSHLIKENTAESTNINLSNQTHTHELFNSFMRNYTSYCSHISHEITRENDKLSKLSFQLNSLKTEIERLKNRKTKLRSILENHFQLKFFLLCVKNKTNNIEKFNHDDYLVHQQDKDNRLLAVKNYEVRRSLIRKKISKAKFSFDQSMFKEQNYSIANYIPRYINQPIFKSIEQFEVIFDDLSVNLSCQLNEFKLKSDQLMTLQNEANELRVQHLKAISFIQETNKEIVNKEAILKVIKAQYEELRSTLNSLPNSHHVPFIGLRWKIASIYKDTIKELPKCSILSLNMPKGMSHILFYLKTLELCLNYLIVKHKEYQIKCKDRYDKLKSKIDKESKIRQAINVKAFIQKKTQEKIKKVLSHKMKILFLPRRKVINKYNIIDVRKGAQLKDDLRKKHYEEAFARTCFSD